MEINSQDFGKGGLLSPYDIRDYWYTPAPRGEIDWEKGFDIENKVGKITIKNQGKSGSCGGQAWSYYGEVLEAIATKSYEPRSARWIYSHTFAPGGGSRGSDNCNFVVKYGFAKEDDATSYEKGKVPSESFMETVPELTAVALDEAQTSKALSYLKVTTDIDTIANAILEHNGVIMAIYGQNNGTWHSAYPKRPMGKVWCHWLYVGKFKMIDGKKYIGVINSWGDKIGEKGIQWIGEEYFASDFITEAWTLAWDYKPALNKVLMIKTIGLLKKLVGLLTLQHESKT